jgi:dihydroneopterin aldolase
VTPDASADRITVRGIRATGFHGVYAEERRTGQPFVVDVVLHLDLAPAAASDDVTATVHYGELAEQVVAAIEGDPVDLIETLAQRVAEIALSYPVVGQVEVTVHKPEAPVGVPFSDVAVTLVRGRS